MPNKHIVRTKGGFIDECCVQAKETTSRYLNVTKASL